MARWNHHILLSLLVSGYLREEIDNLKFQGPNKVQGKTGELCKKCLEMVRAVGIEPTTYGLRVHCSAN